MAAFSVQDDAVPQHVHGRNNIFVTTGGVSLVRVQMAGTDLVFQGNDYWSSGDACVLEWNFATWSSLDGPDGLRSVAPDFEMLGKRSVAVMTDPRLAHIGDADTVGDSDDLVDGLTGYRMQAGSTLAGAGVDLRSLRVSWDAYDFGKDTFLRSHFSTQPADLFGHDLSQRRSWGLGAGQGDGEVTGSM
jgi:hypothetical protein